MYRIAAQTVLMGILCLAAPSAIQDKTPKPPGLLPKNVQSWLLAGLAVLMIVIMWLTG